MNTAVQRLFLALWPGDAVRAQLMQVRDTVPARGRPVADANLHLTLVFMGSVAVSRRPAVEAAAAGAAAPAFTLELDQVGYWPRARVAWLGSTAPPPALTGLVDCLQTRLAAAGFGDPDPRPYRPHVTLLRHVDKRLGPPPALQAPVTWPVSSVSLVESVT